MLACFLEDSAERADLAENQLGKLRAKNRSTVSVNRSSPSVSRSIRSLRIDARTDARSCFSVTFANPPFFDRLPSFVLRRFDLVK